MTPKNDSSSIPVTGFMLAFAGSILFSTKAIIVKKAFADTHTDALTLLMLRMVFALPFFIGVAILSGNKKENVTITPKQWLSIIGLGIFGYYLSSLFDFIGLQYISAGLERLILFLYPSFVLLINAAIFKQKISGIQKIALALTYAGIAIAYAGELGVDYDNAHFLLGSILIFCCAITFAVYLVGSGKIIPLVGATRFTSYAMLASTAGIFLHFLIAGNYNNMPAGNSFWGYGFLLAIIATVIPGFLVSNAMKKIGSNNVAIISSIGPVSTIVQAHFILGERIFFEQVIATMLVIAGVLLTGWKGRDIVV
ncbi:MAG: family transporter [Ferruginibacter sp.]|uniref:DMT family transporter n=1 Tax=Ferruginibacter sp. TaxID=1940288 RepID=UPI002659ABC1|nr:DMT family transporter [Ferruginibacter sp.]MDB5277920.1 family transporter [Ferruginibacter sp.]